MGKFNDKQNEVFGNIFGEIKKRPDTNYTTTAKAMMFMDDENFKRLYKDEDNTIIGSQHEIKQVDDRAAYLELKNL